VLLFNCGQSYRSFYKSQLVILTDDGTTDDAGEELPRATISELDINPTSAGGLVGRGKTNHLNEFPTKSENPITDVDCGTVAVTNKCVFHL
jgi:hypothetical protein